MSQIRAIALLRSIDLLLCRNFAKKNYESDIQLVMDHMQQSNPRVEERVSLKTANGKWSYKLDDNKICYAVLSSESYPDRQIFAMIKEIEKELKKMPDYSFASPSEIEKYTRIWIKDLQEKYDNLSSVDKVIEAQVQIDSVQLIMEDNLRKMIDNNTQVDQLDGKADKMKEQSKAFHSQAHDLARIMYWRNMKLKIIIGLIILALLLYIIVPIIAKAS